MSQVVDGDHPRVVTSIVADIESLTVFDRVGMIESRQATVSATILHALSLLDVTEVQCVRVRGVATLDAKITIAQNNWLLDLSEALITAKNALNDDMFLVSGTYFGMFGGRLEGNSGGNASGSCINVGNNSQRFFLGERMKLNNAKQYGVYLSGNPVGVGTIGEINIENCLSHGMLVAATVADCIYSKLNIGGNGGSGISMGGGASILRDLIIWSNGVQGIDLYANENLLASIRANNNVVDGIRINGGLRNVLSAITAYSNGAWGINEGGGANYNLLNGAVLLPANTGGGTNMPVGANSKAPGTSIIT